jgi:4-amino-4-deoxy-L-arabinose transferase-like glycosyltransferase
MKRLVAIAAVTLSLALAIAASAVWIRSHWRVDFVDRRVPDGVDVISSAQGRLIVQRTRDARWTNMRGWAGGWERGSNRVRDRHDLVAPYLGSTARRFLGFAFVDDRSPDGSTRRTALAIPYWSIVLLLPIPLLLALLRARRRRWRQRHAHCLTCGYDLRASQDRCPECGTAIPA